MSKRRKYKESDFFTKDDMRKKAVRPAKSLMDKLIHVAQKSPESSLYRYAGYASVSDCAAYMGKYGERFCLVELWANDLLEEYAIWDADLGRVHEIFNFPFHNEFLILQHYLEAVFGMETGIGFYWHETYGCVRIFMDARVTEYFAEKARPYERMVNSIVGAQTLDDLCKALNVAEQQLADATGYGPRGVEELLNVDVEFPVFVTGEGEPDWVIPVWSYDATRVLRRNGQANGVTRWEIRPMREVVKQIK